MTDMPNATASGQAARMSPRGLLAAIGRSIRDLGSHLAGGYYKIVFALTAPVTRLAVRLEATEQNIQNRVTERDGRLRRVGNWLWRLPVRLPRWLLQRIAIGIVDGPVWLASMAIVIGALFFLVITPITYSEWVGGAWYAGLFVWWLSTAYTTCWMRGLGQIGRLVAMGVTPQFVFLLLYNGLPDTGLAVPQFLAPVIKGYEYLVVSVNALLQPIGDVAWYWWVGAACALLMLAWMLEAPRLLGTALRLREGLSMAVFILTVTSSLGFSHLVAVNAWEPNVQLRLQAGLKEQAFYETTISLSNDLSRWFSNIRGRATILPVYVQGFQEAIREMRTGRDGAQVKTEDIKKGMRAAANALVPGEVATIAVADGVPHGGQKAIPGTIEELLRVDAHVKVTNSELKVRAAQVRASAVAVISQVVNVPVSSIPMLREILGEMINTTAEQISKQVVDRVPVERGIKTVQNTVETVRGAVSAASDKIAEILFMRGTPAAGDLAHAKVALGTLVTNEIRKATQTRVDAEARSARSSRARR